MLSVKEGTDNKGLQSGNLTTGLNPFDAASALAHQADIVCGQMGLLNRPALADSSLLYAGEHVWDAARLWAAGNLMNNITLPAPRQRLVSQPSG